MKYIFLFLCSLFLSQSPKVSSGKLIEYPKFSSKFIGERMIRVWLPENYNSKTKYQVLFANDGQMLWDATTTWNQQEWRLDETMANLIENKKIKPTIVVAIDNAGRNRHSEYFPQKPFESLSQKTQDSLFTLQRNEQQKLFQNKVYSDQYLKFLVTELKPFIDKEFNTLKESKNTFIMGSSMGGLISSYAVCEYPEVFGGAICLSTHWIGVFNADNNPIPKVFYSYLEKNLPNPKNHKFYFDFGTATLDQYYEPFQKEVDRIMKKKKFKKNNWQTLKFEGKDHSEKAWAERLHIPLIMMLK